MKKRFFLIACLLTAYTCMFQKTANASDVPPIVNPLKGSMNQLVKGANNYIDLTTNIDTAKVMMPVNRVTNVISFYLNEDTTMFLSSNFIAKVKYHLYYKNAAGTLDSLKDQWLEISYRGVTGDSAYEQRKSFYFYNAHYTKIVVDSFYTNASWNVKPALILMNEMRVNADYKFQCTVNNISNVNFNQQYTQEDELYVSWTKPEGADEFDLEWTYIDSSALSLYKTSGNFDPILLFDNNSTRVTVDDSLTYRIPLLYDGGGVLFYRVRPVQNKINGKRIEGKWSTGGSNTWYYSFAGHQLPLNWQASTSFAEEGKRKSVVQYFDGTLRSRQTVTKDNTSQQTVVAETFYDHQGRPVIQVLPAPTLNTIISYTQNFNRMNTGEYDKSRYDTLLNPSAYCNTSADTMSVLGGASQYYSANNPQKNSGFNKFIPDAAGYPFTETQYTQDNTGRISKQSGVGPDHKLGSGYETKYYYGAASQREMDAIFGTEVGNYSHYFKNMVRDANGQYSVSYVDMKGRTIATALAGKLADSIKLDTLASYYTATITEKLTDSSSNTMKGLTMEASKGLIVTKAGDHRFQYSLLPDSINIKDCDSLNICYDCYYDLEVTISGDCNNELIGGSVLKIVKTNLTINPPDTSCSFLQAPFVIDTTFNLPEGSYLITKKLTISKFAADYYRDSIFLNANACKTKEQFIQEQIDSMRLQANCEITCETCEATVSNWETFRNNYMLESGYLFSDTATHRGEAWASFQEAIAVCKEICGKKGLIDDIRYQMLADVTPPSGQYANRDSIDTYSIFRKFPFFVGDRQYTKVTFYTDENGKRDSVFNSNGELVPPTALSIDEFVTNFKTSWADSLLRFHPEYCFLNYAEQHAASYEWDEQFLNTETFAEAKAKGFLNPSGVSGVSGFKYNTTTVTDPLMLSSAVLPHPQTSVLTPVKQLLNDKLVNNQLDPNTSNYLTIWTIASFVGKCKDKDGSCAALMMDVTNAFDTTVLCAGELDMAWRAFREAYYKAKQQILYDLQVYNCGSVPSVGSHEVRFINPSSRDNATGFTSVSDTTAAKQFVKTELYKEYSDNCTAYAEQWLLQLSQCPAYDTANLRIEALPHLINVCIKGSDTYHPFGSSSISPDSSYTFNSFQDVIRWYNTNHNITDSILCNVYAITNPPAYGQQSAFADKPIWNKPDSCDCARITDLKAKYTISQSAYSSFSDYMLKKQGTVISNATLDSLVNLCNGTITCNFLSTPLTLPPSMQCGVKDVCVDCIVVDSVYQRFKIAYPLVTPTQEDVQDTVQQTKNQLFANFMNNKLGFNYPHTTYIQFMDSCNVGGGNGGSLSACDSLQKIAFDFKRYYYTKTDSVSLDSSGCNVAYWRLTQGGWPHDRKIKMSEYRQNGYWKQPLKDSLYTQLDINYVPPAFCVETGFALEAKVRFVRDSLTEDIYTRRSSNFWDPYYGAFGISFDFTTTIGGRIVTRDNYNRSIEYINLPAYWASVVVPNSSNITPYRVVDDPSGVLPLDDWATYKWKFRNDTMRVYINDSLLSTRTFLGNHISKFQNLWFESYGIGLEMDDLKMYDGKDSILFYDDFSLTCVPAETPRLKNCPIEPCDTAFKNYYNLVRGTNLMYQQIIEQYQVNCGSIPDFCSTAGLDTTSINCTELELVKKAYYQDFVTPASGYVDYNLRTFAGNKTPDEGPKGVFDVNNNLIGNTVSGTVTQIKNSYASIWNSSSTNNTVGTLSLLENGKFRLTLNEGQTAPCNGIVGMRYYQFDFKSDTLNAFNAAEGSFVDYGDGEKGLVSLQQYSRPTANTFVTVGSGSTGSVSRRNPTLKPVKSAWLHHYYPDTSLKTITVYHTDVNGSVGFDLWNASSYGVSMYATKLRYLSNIRGYFPNELVQLSVFSTKDSTINNFSQIVNFNQINSLGRIMLSNSSPSYVPTSLDNIDFDQFPAYPTLSHIRFRQGEIGNPASKQVEFHKVFRNLPVNYPKLSWLELYEFGQDVNVDSINFALPNLVRFDFDGTANITSTQIDKILIELASATQRDSGWIHIRSYAGVLRTSASNAAVTTLANRKWAVAFNGAYEIYNSVPFPNISVTLDSIPFSNQFTDYFNQSFGTSLTYHQIEKLYQTKCGKPLNYCSAPMRTDIVLCGKSEPVYKAITDIQSPCADSTELGIIKGTILYEAYRDSIKNSFEEKYLAKCLQVYKYESFTVTRPVSEFHYTLYYYDQAGNLVKTVPPAGVNPVYRQTWLDSVATARTNNTKLVPTHTLYTTYRYNTLNQVVAQKTPDAGTSSFWYDRLGRLVVSQNAKQFAQATKLYSYTGYDALGRITEVGQKPQTTIMTNTTSRNQTSLDSWIANASFVKQQVTYTYYDIAVVNTGVNANIVQQNLRNRVSYTKYMEAANNPDWNSAVFYSYDIHGNVDTLLNDYGNSSYTQTQNPMNLRGHRWKKLVYKYDLISGKVNHVAYQPRQRDAIYHRYNYDAENRLVMAEISTDSLYWERDAKYDYYRHGPLARTVLGHQNIQGLDYAYTLQGWLKGVNGTVMNPAYDMGLDGNNTTAVARDTFGFSLYYHGNDYTAINDANRFAGLRAKLVTAGVHKPLFNGNISAMAVNIGVLNKPVLYNYTYDQLNRITAMDAYNGTNTGANLWSGTLTATNEYKERISYDANGNILRYLRQGTGAKLDMDSLSYKYNAGTNQLNWVKDIVANNEYRSANSAPYEIEDINNQAANNYTYDQIGNLVSDAAESITTAAGGIKWNVYGKITEINKATTGNGSVKKVSYTYDAAGNRISKKVERYNSGGTDHTFYVRDASGNTMSVYTYTDSLRVSEQYLYGSSRLGNIAPSLNLDRAAATPVSMPLLTGGNFATFTRGSKFFELSNHLGNVLVTLSDKKKGVQNGSSGSVLYYLPIVKSANDYFPGGMQMPGRKFSASSLYRYGFNGKENDNEVKGEGNQQDYGMRIYDTRLGRFLSVDPLTKTYPWYTPYQFAGNSPIQAIDLDGLEDVHYIFIWIKSSNGTEVVQKLAGEVVGEDMGKVDKQGHAVYDRPFRIIAHYPVESLGTKRYVSAEYKSEEAFSNAKAEDFYKSALLQGADAGAELAIKYGDLTAIGFVTSKLTYAGSQALRVYADRKMLQYSASIVNKDVLTNLINQNIRQQIARSGLNAETKLAALEASTTNAHFLSRHGAQTTLQQQLTRATTGLTPDGVLGRALPSSRFHTHELQLEAFEKAQAAYTPAMAGKGTVIEMGKTVGEGYLRGGGAVRTSTRVQVYYNNNGEIITMYPLLPRR
jgi:RHS repeat-associated protein